MTPCTIRIILVLQLQSEATLNLKMSKMTNHIDINAASTYHHGVTEHHTDTGVTDAGIGHTVNHGE